ncbi:sugar transferase [Sphingomonas sp. CBMAI 2297]|uniref:sugar transferase n=1 Tax=Sphingomonas sp. CBMAI 2297 TaxID=2991720 RepID=UPI0024559AA1|nr:sugar transferase [Sphingomonas sp. CBMAI 2297]MDH4742986.1 sugar transferase [Sphingomonas sp. CBMAI 2297]
MKSNALVAEDAPARPRFASHFARIRTQLGVGLILAIIVPAVLRYLMTGLEPSVQPEQNSLIGSVISIVLGYFVQRRLGVFPGFSSVGYIIPSFSAAFALVVLCFFNLRLDYSRVPFIINYLSSLFWFTIIFILAYRAKTYRLAVVPGGDAEQVLGLEGVEWIMLKAPVAPQPGWDGVVADLRADPADEWERMIADAALAGVPVYGVKQTIEQLTGRSEIEHLSENTLGSLNPNQAYFKIKQSIDWLAAVAALLVLAPVLLIVSLLIKLDTPGPVFFRQERVGFRGKSIRVFKFRTMNHVVRAKAEVSARDAAITQENDSRITRVGRFLRRTRIDELPQILNILRGEMSWIGPRPEAKPLAEWYEAELPFYHYRHIVRPGITGWAQVRQGHVADVTEVRGKLYYDFYYIKNFSFWLDVLIVLLTFRIVVSGHGAK